MGSVYTVEKRAAGWVISAGDHEIMTCSRRATAIRIIQQADLYLREDGFRSPLDACGGDVEVRPCPLAAAH
jgi:hypothetical protein